jgi:hypothetical protein
MKKKTIKKDCIIILSKEYLPLNIAITSLYWMQIVHIEEIGYN